MSRKRSTLRIQNNLGFLVLGFWLLLSGLASFVPSIRGLGEAFPFLALAAGALILLGQ